MEKQDLIFFIAAIGIVLILALVVKPLLSGEPLEFFPPSGDQESPSVTTAPTLLPKEAPVTAIPTTIPVPTPTPGWDGRIKTVQFVDPSEYHLNLAPSIPLGTVHEVNQQDRTLVTYAKIQGRWSETTEIVQIPFPCWELHYTADPLVDPSKDTVSVFPRIQIEVKDANDPNRYVRTIDSGILDPRSFTRNDPRPWIETFYEGNRNYYFIITPAFVSSYTLEIKVPRRYL
jgi:hypothetical protein